MVKPKDIDSVITLELSGDITTSGDFRELVAAFDDFLKAVTKAACGDEAGVQWAIRPKAGSIQLGVNPMGRVDVANVERCKAVTSQILGGEAEFVEYDDIVKPIGAFARRKGVHLWVGQERTPVTEKLYSILKAPTQKPYQLHGTVEGRLTMLSEQRNLAIHEPVWGRRIECSVPDGQLEAMRALWRKRVTAEGIVHYDDKGYPTKIDAEKIDPFPDDKDLPSPKDVRGILRAD